MIPKSQLESSHNQRLETNHLTSWLKLFKLMSLGLWGRTRALYLIYVFIKYRLEYVTANKGVEKAERKFKHFI